MNQVAELISSIGSPIVVGFSGGKDSSAVVKLLWAAAQRLGALCPPIEIVYCDTQVENMLVDKHVKLTLSGISEEANNAGLPISVKVIVPELHRGFFVRIIGRGYPPPTSHFRWCTTDIRIRPFKAYLQKKNSKAWIAVGTRFGESRQRDRTLSRSLAESGATQFLQRQRDGFRDATLITPIIDYETADVWELLCELPGPDSIDVHSLAKLYKEGSGECPTVRDFRDKPCTKARFGCWTCTVVRRDKSAENLISSGHEALMPMFSFRNWLAEFRNDQSNRCVLRRNGGLGPGAFTIAARSQILKRLNTLEGEIGFSILSLEQRAKITELVLSDVISEKYLASDPNYNAASLEVFLEKSEIVPSSTSSALIGR